MNTLIGKYYTWGKVSIFFDVNGMLCTPWSMGEYVWLDLRTVRAKWGGFSHTLTFNETFTGFTSIRDSDGEITHSTLVEFAKNSTIPSIQIDYKKSVTQLCLLSKKYNIDKSSQRDNPGPNDSNHCHPYSLLYSALFHNVKHTTMNICEIGIAEGRSLLLWNEYLANSHIYGFDFFQKWLNNWNDKHSHLSRVHVNAMDVRDGLQIIKSLESTGVLFDCIIDDSSHMFYDMIRIIKSSVRFLKPGGMIIIEDIRRSYDEAWFYDELKPILGKFQKVFFVDLDHSRRNSGVVNNDKVLVLIKQGDTSFNFNLI
jgi:SAM-dependent methyltransferase